jgi:hypothetical protein
MIFNSHSITGHGLGSNGVNRIVMAKATAPKDETAGASGGRADKPAAAAAWCTYRCFTARRPAPARRLASIQARCAW